MELKRVKLEWTETHYTLEEYEVTSGGAPIGLNRAMENAVMKSGLFQRTNVVPGSIKFTLVED